MKIWKSVVTLLLLTFAGAAWADNGDIERQVCEPNPYLRGRIAAQTVCVEIANLFVPTYKKKVAEAISEAGEPKICTIRDVVRCKRAMSDFLRLTADGRACGRLIRENVRLSTGAGFVFANDVWEDVVMDTCNLR